MGDLTGVQFIGGVTERGAGGEFRAIDPRTGSELEPVFRDADERQVGRACGAAAQAAAGLADAEPAQRAALLRAIAAGITEVGDELVRRVGAETGLPTVRVENERGRTVAQLEQFAALVEEGSWVDARIEHGDAERQPLPRPDLRRMSVPLGPVAVFGASNFPLAFSVAGGDTASALAAGCPVVVKAHPAHPGTSELVAKVVAEAVQESDLPSGTFSLLHGQGHEVGRALVRHAAVQAVGFTGSHAAGRALCDVAAARAQPIPVFAEMGSANPVVILPRALAARGPAIAERLAAAALLAQGQFCTSPGLWLWIDGPGADVFAAALRERFRAAESSPGVHPSVRRGFDRALAEVGALPVQIAASGVPAGEPAQATALRPTLLRASADALLAHARLGSEIYGPAVLGVACRDEPELLRVVATLHGHLTATVHGDGDDFVRFGPVVHALRQKVGRLVANGVPTGVEVSPAMVHGGPWPASSDPRYTAVGTPSIRRWARPVCWQDWPHDQLPPELQDDNPRGVGRVVDGIWRRALRN